MTKKQPTPKQPEETERERIREREFTEAVARIYRKYGTDLSAFRRDVETELAKRETHSYV